MKRPIVVLPLVLSCVAATNAMAQQPGSEMTGFVSLPFEIDGASRTAALYVPVGYDASEPWPLIVFLHGAGGTGDNGDNAVNEWMGSQPIVRAIQADPDRFKSLVVLPRSPTGSIWMPLPADAEQSAWRQENVNQASANAEAHITAVIDATIAAFAVDEDRIVLTGQSMGGEGAVRYAALHSGRFAAVAPSAPFSAYFPSDVSALAELPVWIFQGEVDPISSPAYARRMVEAISAAGGTPKYTEYEGLGHRIPFLVYSDAQVIEWMLSQRR